MDSPNNVHAIQNKQEKFFSEPSVKFKSSALSGRLNTRTHHHMNHAFLQQVLARYISVLTSVGGFGLFTQT